MHKLPSISCFTSKQFTAICILVFSTGSNILGFRRQGKSKISGMKIWIWEWRHWKVSVTHWWFHLSPPGKILQLLYTNQGILAKNAVKIQYWMSVQLCLHPSTPSGSPIASKQVVIKLHCSYWCRDGKALLAGYIPRWFISPEMTTHQSTNSAWCIVTSLPLNQTATVA